MVLLNLSPILAYLDRLPGLLQGSPGSTGPKGDRGEPVSSTVLGLCGLPPWASFRKGTWKLPGRSSNGQVQA